MLPVTLLRIILIITFVLGLSAITVGVLALRARSGRSSLSPVQRTIDDEH